MDARDALFDDLKTLSDDADALGLTDVALVLEFAMDVYLMNAQAVEAPKGRLDVARFEGAKPAEGAQSGWSISNFPLAQIYQKAS